MAAVALSFVKETRARSTELCSQLQKRVGEGRLRELVREEYLLLYARQENSLYLLAIKHHRQLSFDFVERWVLVP